MGKIANPNLLIYVVRYGFLLRLIQEGKGDSPEADSHREHMDDAWKLLTAEEVEQANVVLAKVQEAHTWFTDLAKVQPMPDIDFSKIFPKGRANG